MAFVFLMKHWMMEKENNKNIIIKDWAVTQSNPLIEATYPRTVSKKDGTETDIDLKVTTRAHKVSRLIVSLISPDDEDLRFYRIDISTLKSYLGYKPEFPNGKFYQDLREIAIRLNKQPIEIRPEPKRVITAFFISSYELNYKTGEIIFEISGQLKPFLLQLKNNFTSFHLNNIPRLSSGYSIRLYEILFQYKTIGKRVFEDIDRLQQMIGSSYEKYSHFKARVLEPTKKDITKNTNITFEYEEVKTGKKVTKLIFHIKSNVPTAEPQDPQFSLAFDVAEKSVDNTETDVLKLTLKGVGIAFDTVEAYIKLGFDVIKDEKKRQIAAHRCGNTEAFYSEKINLLKNSKSGTENPVGFFIKALQEDWVTSKATKEVENQRQLKEQRDKQSALKQLEKRLLLMTKQYTLSLKPIFEKLASDVNIFNEAYQHVLNEFGEGTMFYRSIMDQKTPRAAYQNNVALSSIMNDRFFKLYPQNFEETQKIGLEIEAIKKEIKTLQDS